MTRGFSLNIGIGKLENNYMGNNYGNMPSAINDAENLKSALPDQLTKILLKNATVSCLTDKLNDLAVGSEKLCRGDLLIVTYAGHGGTVFDDSGTESDCRDETWCLYDDQFLDDELLELWTRFDEGVRIVVISDSCHSGTISDFYKTGITREIEIVLRKNNVDLGNLERAILYSKGIAVADFDVEKLQKDKHLIRDLKISQKFNTDVNLSNLTDLAENEVKVRTFPVELLKAVTKSNKSKYFGSKKNCKNKIR